MAIWYTGSTKWTAVTAWAASTSYAAGVVRRQLAAPTVGNERVFVCIVAGTSGGSEPSWVITNGAKTTDNTVTWMECTGKHGVNGDATNSPNWNTVKNTAVVLGRLIQRISSGSLQICTTAGTCGNGAEPAFSNTAGTTTADGTATWTSLGALSNFGSYAAPFARMQIPATSGFMAAGDTCYISNNHAETQAASMTISPANGTSALPLSFICVTDTATPPTAVNTTATISTTGANNLTVGSTPAYYYGLNFSAGDSSNAANLQIQTNSLNLSTFESCKYTLGNTNTGSTFTIFSRDGSNTVLPVCLDLINCNFVFGATGQSALAANSSDTFNMIGGGWAVTGSVPTSLFKKGGFLNKPSTITMRDVDMGNITGTIYDLSSDTGYGTINATFQNCKFGSGVNPFAVNGGTGSKTHFVQGHNCDSGATNYKYFIYTYAGSILQETSITHTGGASDGTTALSWNMTTNANSSILNPLKSEAIAQWQDTTGGSKTATIELTTDSTLTNADCWLELEYLSSSGAPLGATITTKVALLATPATLTTSSVTWGGAAKTNKYKLAATFTPQLKGAIKARLVLAKASATIYVDPLITVT